MMEKFCIPKYFCFVFSESKNVCTFVEKVKWDDCRILNFQWLACMHVVWMDVKCLNSSHFLLKFSWGVNSWMKQKSHCKVCKSVIVKVKKKFRNKTLKSQWQFGKKSWEFWFLADRSHLKIATLFEKSTNCAQLHSR